MMKKTVLGISVLSTLAMVSDVYAQATYFGDEPEGVQSFQQNKDAMASSGWQTFGNFAEHF